MLHCFPRHLVPSHSYSKPGAHHPRLSIPSISYLGRPCRRTVRTYYAKQYAPTIRTRIVVSGCHHISPTSASSMHEWCFVSLWYAFHAGHVPKCCPTWCLLPEQMTMFGWRARCSRRIVADMVPLGLGSIAGSDIMPSPCPTLHPVQSWRSFTVEDAGASHLKASWYYLLASRRRTHHSNRPIERT